MPCQIRGQRPLRTRPRRDRAHLRCVSGCYRIVMLNFPSDVMTQVVPPHYCPPHREGLGSQPIDSSSKIAKRSWVNVNLNESGSQTPRGTRGCAKRVARWFRRHAAHDGSQRAPRGLICGWDQCRRTDRLVGRVPLLSRATTGARPPPRGRPAVADIPSEAKRLNLLHQQELIRVLSGSSSMAEMTWSSPAWRRSVPGPTATLSPVRRALSRSTSAAGRRRAQARP